LGTLGLKVKYLDWGDRLRGRMYHFLLLTYHSIIKKIKTEGNSFFGFLLVFIDLLGHIYENDQRLSQEPKIIESSLKAFWNAQLLLFKIKY
jgi:hypothetical protein